MRAKRRADIWNEVWADYDARQSQRLDSPRPWRRSWEVNWEPAEGAKRGMRPGLASQGFGQDSVRQEYTRRPAGAPVARVRPLRHAVAAILAGLALLAWLVLPWLLALRLSVSIGQGDAPGLLRQFDTPAAMASLRAGMTAELREEGGEGARRFLSGMAERMASSWEKPEAVAAWLALRARGGMAEGSPVALSRLRGAWPLGLASFRVEYGPSHGDGGVAFDIAWQGDGFRVTGLRFLDAQPDTGPAPYRAGPIMAMR